MHISQYKPEKESLYTIQLSKLFELYKKKAENRYYHKMPSLYQKRNQKHGSSC